MRLNPDCIRDILIATEEMTDGKKIITINCNHSFKEYSAETLRYHFLQCLRYGYFVDGKFLGNTNLFQFTDISPKAHEFLANIRDNTIWNKVKKKACEAGVNSIDALVQIALEIVKYKVSSLFP